MWLTPTGPNPSCRRLNTRTQTGPRTRASQAPTRRARKVTSLLWPHSALPHNRRQVRAISQPIPTAPALPTPHRARARSPARSARHGRSATPVRPERPASPVSASRARHAHPTANPIRPPKWTSHNPMAAATAAEMDAGRQLAAIGARNPTSVTTHGPTVQRHRPNQRARGAVLMARPSIPARVAATPARAMPSRKVPRPRAHVWDLPRTCLPSCAKPHAPPKHLGGDEAGRYRVWPVSRLRLKVRRSPHPSSRARCSAT